MSPKLLVIGSWKGLTFHLILRCEVMTVRAVRHLVFGDPLSGFLTTLTPYFGHLHNFTKIDLNPWFFVASPR